MNWYWLGEGLWRATIGAFVGLGVGTLFFMGRNVSAMRVNTAGLSRLVSTMEEMARYFGRIARALEALAVAAGRLTKTSGEAPSYRCLDCGMVSYNMNDIVNAYCGHCHKFANGPEAL